MTSLYELVDVGVRLGTTEVLRGISVGFKAREMITIVGPNGAGKSTLISVLSGYRDTYQGHCRFRGRELSSWKKRDLARDMAFIPQMLRLEFPFTAEQVVFMGRTPHCHGLFESPADRDAVRRAMQTTDTLAFASREYCQLSAGERQRVVLAAALAQGPSVLLLDEPTTFLDLKHQISTYGLLKQLAVEGIAVIAVTHDLNLAATYSDRIAVLSQGEIVADGKPEEVLKTSLLEGVFEVAVKIREGPTGRPWVFYDEGRGPNESRTGE